MRNWTGILFAIFMVLLFLEILVGFPIHLEKEPDFIPTTTVTISGDNEQALKNRESRLTEQKMEGVHLVESRRGSRDWELLSESAQNSQSSGDWTLQKVKVLFYNSDAVEFIVTGKTGHMDSKNKDITIEGDVTIKSLNGYQFLTNSATYFATDRRIIAPGAVKMIGPPDGKRRGLVLSGADFESQVDKSTMTIHHRVSAIQQIEDSKEFHIHSESAEFSGKGRRAQFAGNVSIDVGPLKMEGPEASFEYRPGVDILQSVVVRGGVKVSDLDKFATSDSVQFDPEQNKFTFSGRPRVVQNSDEITGDQIVFIDGGKKVKVEKIRAKTDKGSK